MKKIIFFLLFPLFIQAQDFLTTIHFQDTLGNIDSVQVGYDITATAFVDPIFGEMDIQDIPLHDSLDIRLAQVNLNLLECEYMYVNTSLEAITYYSKIDILPRNCEGYDTNTSINNGILPFTTILIKNDYLPLKMKWDSLQFTNICESASLVTDWHPGIWFDAICADVTLPRTMLSEQNEVWINTPSGIQIENQFGDTLSMFFLAIIPDFLDNISLLKEENIKVFPNPSTNVLFIEGLENTNFRIEIYDAIGQKKITTDDSKIDISTWENGMYYLQVLTKEGQQVIRKFIKTK